jgi:BlaI family penicillinase repressor
MKKRVPTISEAEWRVMRVLWLAQGEPGPAPVGGEPGGMTSAEVVAALAGEADWKPQTVKTLLGRLVEKGAVGYVARGREYVYHPLVAEADAVRAESGTFLDRMFGGALAPMVAHFVKGRSISPQELAALRAILDEAESDARGRGGKARSTGGKERA